MDLRKTIIPKSDQLNADDLITGPRTIKIRDVREGSSDQPVHIYFDGDDNKPYKPCLSMRRLLVQVWGHEGKSYVGKSMTLFLDPSVKWAGVEVGGIRISHVSDITEPTDVLLTVSKGKRRPYTVQPLIVAKKTLTDARFQKALEALEEGKTTVDKLMEYDLTEEQLKQLNK